MYSPTLTGIILLLLVLAGAALAYIAFSLLQEQLRLCVSCGRRGTTEKVDERIMGIFQQIEAIRDADGGPAGTKLVDYL